MVCRVCEMCKREIPSQEEVLKNLGLDKKSNLSENEKILLNDPSLIDWLDQLAAQVKAYAESELTVHKPIHECQMIGEINDLLSRKVPITLIQKVAVHVASTASAPEMVIDRIKLVCRNRGLKV